MESSSLIRIFQAASLWCVWCVLAAITLGGMGVVACASELPFAGESSVSGGGGMHAAVFADTGPGNKGGKNGAGEKKPGDEGEPAPKDGGADSSRPGASDAAAAPIEMTLVVEGRTLPGLLRIRSHRGHSLLPIIDVARALGDQVVVDVIRRRIEVRRATGVTSTFDAALAQVRENEFVVLVASNAADLIFPSDPEELMLPLEIITALLDASLLVDEQAGLIRITRGQMATTDRERKKTRAAWELHGAEYEYYLTSYGSALDHNLTLRSSGRIGNGWFSLVSNSGGNTSSRLNMLRSGTFSYEQPDGRGFVAGDLIMSSNLQFMRSNIRGVSAHVPIREMHLTVFHGRAASGSVAEYQTPEAEHTWRQVRPTFDTNVFGAFLTLNSALDPARRPQTPQISVGAMRFKNNRRSGDLLTGNVQYVTGRSRVQGDVAIGRFSTTDARSEHAAGFGLAAELTASFDLTSELTLQGRYAHTDRNFTGPQAGAYTPQNILNGSFMWRPRSWLTSSLSHTRLHGPGAGIAFSEQKTTTGTISLAPDNWLPRVFVMHSRAAHNHNAVTPKGADSSYTLVNVSKAFARYNLYANWTQNRTNDASFKSLQAGAVIKFDDTNLLQLSQSFSGGALSGTADWLAPAIFNNKLSIGAGLGYQDTYKESMRLSERFTASFSLPRETSVQITYSHQSHNQQVFVSLRGNFIRKQLAEIAARDMGTIAAKSYGSYSGEVYQDINLNGSYDPGVDLPQANVRIKVDGSRYAETDAKGNYTIDLVETGNHTIELDLSSVRADLTLLDKAQRLSLLKPGYEQAINFRLVRTGRLSGMVWSDANENGLVDDGEQKLSDVRVVTGINRDTLTDADGIFGIGDLPPGQHVVLVDEKTLPANMHSTHGSLVVKVTGGDLTGDVMFPVRPTPPEIKRF